MTDDQQVWTTSAGTGNANRKLHTDPDCRALEYARTILGPKPRSVFDEDCEICRFCLDDIDATSSPQSDIGKMLADPDFGPEDLGLSPIGDHGGGSA